jgi:hypothetical protein
MIAKRTSQSEPRLILASLLLRKSIIIITRRTMNLPRSIESADEAIKEFKARGN